jgi:hypothetical protein
MYTSQMKTTEGKAAATAGNRFFQPLQAKLTVGAPNDIYEQEADAVAEKVMRMADHSAKNAFFFQPASMPVQHKCTPCEEAAKKTQRQEQSNAEVAAPQELTNYVESLGNKGTALPAQTQQFFGSRMGYDFSNVKIHTDSVAARSAQSINALAYTSGSNIVFNQNQYQPGTESGKRLLAHELTHVVQQTGSIRAYRNKKAFNFGKNDTASLMEDSFSMKKDKETKPWIEQILVTLDKTVTDVNGYTTYTGTGTVKYYNNPVKWPDLTFSATAGSEDLGMTTKGLYKVTRIEGIGYNSGKYSGTVDKTQREGPMKRYSKNLSANMSYAVFFHGGEALHAGPLDFSSHGCVHLDFSAIQQINYHSVKGFTNVEIKYS